MSRRKGPVEKIRPFEGDKEIAQKIAEHTGLDVIDVLSLALSAGLEAIRRNDYEMPLPLSLQVVDGPGPPGTKLREDPAPYGGAPPRTKPRPPKK